MPPAEFLLVDVSNTFTKVALSSRERVGRASRLATSKLTVKSLKKLLGTRQPKHVIVASVVPRRNQVVASAFPGLFVG